MNNEIALNSGILDCLVALLKTQEGGGKQMNQGTSQVTLRPYIKFAIRCLTSAIRTDPAVNKFYSIDGGVTKILEILEFVEDQEIIANSCKIIRICLRDELLYDRMAASYPTLATLIVDKMAKWNASVPII